MGNKTKQPNCQSCTNDKGCVNCESGELLEGDIFDKLDEYYRKEFLPKEWFAKAGQRTISEFNRFTAEHFAQWMKQQMLENVVLETRVMADSDGDGIDTPYEEWLTLENTEILSLPDNLGLKDGDKVKIIIVKSEQK